MARFRKAVLRTGTYHSPDGDVPVTRERLRHWQSEFGRMKAAKQVVPVDWDHAEQSNREGLIPLSLADFRKRRSARNTVGHLVDLEVTDEGAVLTLDVPDDEASGKADKNLVFVSPVISPTWRDGAANNYEDCITHVDFVNHPVDHSQGPFERIPVEQINQQPAIACALRMGLGSQFYVNKGATNMATAFLPQVIRMAEGEESKIIGWTTEGGEAHPIHNNTGKRKRNKESRGKRMAGKNAVKHMSLMVRMAEGEDPVAADVIPEDDYDNVDEILDMLEEYNIRLPDDTTDENLIERLRTALHTAIAHKEDTEPPALPSEPEAPPVPEEAMAMSLAAVRAIGDQHRDKLSQRLQKLLDTGRCTPDERSKYGAGIGTVKLSLTANGRPVRSELEKWIASREAVPAGSCWTDAQRLSLTMQPGPKAETPEMVKEVLKTVFRR